MHRQLFEPVHCAFKPYVTTEEGRSTYGGKEEEKD